jgi:hypothetical protein
LRKLHSVTVLGVSSRNFDTLAARVGVTLAGRTTYEHSGHWEGDGPQPTARLFVLSHRPAPEISEQQTLVTTGIEDAITAARQAGRPFFQALPEHVHLNLVEAIPAPGVAHLRCEAIR